MNPSQPQAVPPAPRNAAVRTLEAWWLDVGTAPSDGDPHFEAKAVVAARERLAREQAGREVVELRAELDRLRRA